MAKAKAKKKSASSAKKKSARAKKAPSRRAPKEAGLTDEQRQSLMRPPAAYDDSINSLVDAWSQHKNVRIDGLSPAKLRAMAARAERAWQREDAARRKLEAKLRELSDQRLIAEDAVWRAGLDVWDMAKSVGRRRPEVLEAFSFMTGYLGGGGRAKPEPSSDA